MKRELWIAPGVALLLWFGLLPSGHCFSEVSSQGGDVFADGIEALMRRDYPFAGQRLELALQKARRGQDAESVGLTSLALARVKYLRQDDLADAVQVLESALDTPALDDKVRLRIDWFLAFLHCQGGAYEKSLHYAREALEIAETRHNVLEQLVTLEFLSGIYGNLGKSDASNLCLKKLFTLSDHLPASTYDEWFNRIEAESAGLDILEREVFRQKALSVIGYVYYLKQDNEVAERLIQAAMASMEKINSPKTKLVVLLANMQAGNGDFDKAETLYKQALLLAEKETPLTYVDKASVELSVGLFYYGRGQLEEAKHHFLQALSKQPKTLTRIDSIFIKASFFYKKCSLKEQPDYLSQSRQSPAVWHPGSKSILVYLPDTGGEGWKPEYDQYVKNAFARWNKVLDDKFTFVFTDDPAKYDVKVTWYKQSKRLAVYQTKDMPWWAFSSVFTEKAGENVFAAIPKYFLFNDINIYLHDSLGRPYPDKVVAHTVLHEVGHCMGIKEHSPYPGDVMHEGGFSHLTSGELSDRDIATLKALYALKPKYTNDPMRVTSGFYTYVKTFTGPIERIEY